jgi:NitT/TauT family transport system substrate-binding protein
MSALHIMAVRHSAFYSPLLMTIAGGYLRDEGLEPSYAAATPERPVPASIRDGSCQVAQASVAIGFADLERGESSGILHFAQINERDGFFVVGRRPEPEFAWATLAGKKVLVDHLFQPLAMFKYGLHRQGVDFAGLEVIDAGDVDAMEQAFRRGEGDYVHLQGPAAQQLERDGVGHVVAAVGDAIGPVAFSSLCAAPEWLATPMARAFMRAYRRARNAVLAAPAEEIAAREAEAGLFPGIDREVLTRTIAAYQSLGCWSPDPAISRASYETLLDVFLFAGLIRQRHPFDALVVPPPE